MYVTVDVGVEEALLKTRTVPSPGYRGRARIAPKPTHGPSPAALLQAHHAHRPEEPATRLYAPPVDSKPACTDAQPRRQLAEDRRTRPSPRSAMPARESTRRTLLPMMPKIPQHSPEDATQPHRPPGARPSTSFPRMPPKIRPRETTPTLTVEGAPIPHAQDAEWARQPPPSSTAPPGPRCPEPASRRLPRSPAPGPEPAPDQARESHAHHSCRGPEPPHRLLLEDRAHTQHADPHHTAGARPGPAEPAARRTLGRR